MSDLPAAARLGFVFARASSTTDPSLLPFTQRQAATPPVRHVRVLLLDDVGHHLHGADEPVGGADPVGTGVRDVPSRDEGINNVSILHPCTMNRIAAACNNDE